MQLNQFVAIVNVQNVLQLLSSIATQLYSYTHHIAYIAITIWLTSSKEPTILPLLFCSFAMTGCSLAQVSLLLQEINIHAYIYESNIIAATISYKGSWLIKLPNIYVAMQHYSIQSPLCNQIDTLKYNIIINFTGNGYSCLASYMQLYTDAYMHEGLARCTYVDNYSRVYYSYIATQLYIRDGYSL